MSLNVSFICGVVVVWLDGWDCFMEAIVWSRLLQCLMSKIFETTYHHKLPFNSKDDQDCDGACYLKNYSFVITYLLEDEQELSLGCLICLKRIYNF
jgi:hypothetical protein